MRAVYVETSALARAYLHDDATTRAALSESIGSADSVVTSALTAVELRRAVAQVTTSGRVQHGRADEALHRALEVIARADVIPLDELVLARAGGAFPLAIRTLDALHVATALEVQFRREVTTLVMMSRDKRVRDVATAVGLQLV